jgi:hypothetical protein
MNTSHSSPTKQLIERLLQLQDKKWRHYEEEFVDEVTGEVLYIDRRELLTLKHSSEEVDILHVLYERITELSIEQLHLLDKTVIWNDELDQEPLLQELCRRGDLEAAYRLEDVLTLIRGIKNNDSQAMEYLTKLFAQSV